MNFTYSAYRGLISLLKQKDYCFCGYSDYADKKKCVIMRHDIDNSVERAAKLAQVEHEEGIRSTYFVLLKTDFYNPASKRVNDSLHAIKDMGHEIGLHFDETVYQGCSEEVLKEKIREEADILSAICGFPIRSFSMHRPNKVTLEKSLEIPGLVNSYGEEFFRNFKYLSDSRRNWREPVLDVIQSGEYNRLHILTHAFWYGEKEESIQEAVKGYILAARKERYRSFSENIRDLEQIVSLSDITE